MYMGGHVLRRPHFSYSPSSSIGIQWQNLLSDHIQTVPRTIHTHGDSFPQRLTRRRRQRDCRTECQNKYQHHQLPSHSRPRQPILQLLQTNCSTAHASYHLLSSYYIGKCVGVWLSGDRRYRSLIFFFFFFFPYGVRGVARGVGGGINQGTESLNP